MLQCSGPSCYALVIDLGTLCDKNIAKKKISGTPGCLDEDLKAVIVGSIHVVFVNLSFGDEK